jgi:hypothetical protein
LSCFVFFCLGLAEQVKVRVRVWVKVWVGVVGVQLRDGGTFWALQRKTVVSRKLCRKKTQETVKTA